MNNLKYGVLVALLGLAVVFSGLALRGSPQGGEFGIGTTSTINYSNSLSNAALYGALQSLLLDVTNLRANVSFVSSTHQWSIPTMEAFSASTTDMEAINVSVSNAVVGDIILVSAPTSTAQGLNFVGNVINTGLVRLVAINSSTTGYTAVTGSTTVNVWRIPLASFGTPPTLLTATSTSN